MAKKDKEQVIIINLEDGDSEIHVSGKTLSILRYKELLDAIEKIGVRAPKVFVVEHPVMIRLIHESIPREYHNGIILSVDYAGEEQRRYAG